MDNMPNFDNAEQAFITDTAKTLEIDQIGQRETLYNKLIEAYKNHFRKKSKQNRGLKIAFFTILMALISFLIVSMTVMCFVTIKTCNDPTQTITVIISGVATILSTIIALPMIICKYLFHKKEDKQLLEFIVKLKNTPIEQISDTTHADDIF